MTSEGRCSRPCRQRVDQYSSEGSSSTAPGAAPAGRNGEARSRSFSLTDVSRSPGQNRAMDSLTGCVFCKIVDGALPSSRLVDSPRVLAFLDIDPVTPGHALVIPKEHLPDLADLTDDLAGEMLAVARQVAAALRRTALRCEGINLFYADGEAAFQEVFHSHLHVFPAPERGGHPELRSRCDYLSRRFWVARSGTPARPSAAT